MPGFDSKDLFGLDLVQRIYLVDSYKWPMNLSEFYPRSRRDHRIGLAAK